MFSGVYERPMEEEEGARDRGREELRTKGKRKSPFPNIREFSSFRVPANSLTEKEKRSCFQLQVFWPLGPIFLV